MPAEPGDAYGEGRDWRCAKSYDYLRELDRPGWAWEWLRRNPEYRRMYQVHGERGSTPAEARCAG